MAENSLELDDTMPAFESVTAAISALVSGQQATNYQMRRMSGQLDKVVESSNRLAMDIEISKVRDEQFASILDELKLMREDILAIKLRNAQQDGAGKLATVVKDWLPMLVAALAALYTYFKR